VDPRDDLDGCGKSEGFRVTTETSMKVGNFPTDGPDHFTFEPLFGRDVRAGNVGVVMAY
jgi:hypothetical protein